MLGLPREEEKTLINRKRAQFLSLWGGNELEYFPSICHYLTGSCVLGFFGGRWDKKGRHLHPPLLCQQTGINDMIFDFDSHPLMHQYARFSQTKVNTKQVSTNGYFCLKVVILALNLFA